MCSEKQRLANQRNAQKSTGPKTPEGKARSRRNSLKHGLTGAGIVLRKKDEKEIKKRIAAFNEKLAASHEFEDYLIERVAVSSVRTQRCVHLELSELARRRQRAFRRWEKKHSAAVARIAAELDTNPASAVRELKNSAKGCDWLLAVWTALADILDEQGGLTAVQTAHMLRLLGKQPTGAYPANEQVINLRKHALAALCEGTDVQAKVVEHNACDSHPDTSACEAPDGPELFGAYPERLGELPDISESRRWLMDLIQAQRAELEQLRDTTWREKDGPDLAQSQARILVDTGEKGVKLLRYENSAEMTFHRCLNQLIATRKQEPAYHTINRLERKNEHPSRVWMGTDWLLWDQYQAALSGGNPRPSERAARELQECGAVGAAQVAEEPAIDASMEPAAVGADEERGDGQATQQNEAISQGSSDDSTGTCGNSEVWTSNGCEEAIVSDREPSAGSSEPSVAAEPARSSPKAAG